MQVDLEHLTFDDKGLIATIVVEESSKEVLMFAYMNKESLTKTLDLGELVFYSRSRKKLWHKGESSGNFLKLKHIKLDCDFDTLLIEVDVLGEGKACHTGSKSCFFNSLKLKKN